MSDKDSKDGKIKSLVKENSNVWNNYYKVHQKGAVGNLYPNEPLIRIASKIFHSPDIVFQAKTCQVSSYMKLKSN